MSYRERRKRLDVTFQPREEWWSRVFATPIAGWILTVIADWRCITPNRLTILSFGMTALSGILILGGDATSLIWAGIILQVAYIIDCMDGQLARYRSLSSRLGSLFDKWSDFVKFPFVILSLSLQVHRNEPTSMPLILGLAAVFLISYQPYFKLIALKECGIEPWDMLNRKGFLQRNLRFFLFEEAQWYLVVSVCLFLNKPMAALAVLVVSQGGIVLMQTGRVFRSAMHLESETRGS